MLVEELVIPLKVASKANAEKISRVDARNVLLDLLAKIEKRPLRAAEARLLKSEIAEYLVEHDLGKDEFLDKMLNFRFSLSFMPTVSSLNLPNTHSSESSPRNTPYRVDTTRDDRYSPVPLNLPPSTNRAFKIKGNYYMCSVRRHQSTLWTSYRMFLDGTKEMTSSGELANYQESEPGNMLLGAKKLKSGISAQCFVWKTPESKGWKEKNAIGKIVRSNTTYLGMALNGGSGAGDAGTADAGEETEAAGGAVDWKEFGSGETYEPTQFNTATAATTSATGASAPLTSEGGGGVSSASAAAAGNGGGAGAAIAIAVNSKGMDKLIHLTAVMAKSPSNNTGGAATAAVGGSSSFNFDSVDDGQQLVTELEGVLKNIQAAGVSATSVLDEAAAKYVVMKSKLPRKVTSDANGKKGIHTMAFSKESRVKSASRKNLVVDSIYYESTESSSSSSSSGSGGGGAGGAASAGAVSSNAGGGASGASAGTAAGGGVAVTGGLIRSEWGIESDRIPMLQVGSFPCLVFD